MPDPISTGPRPGAGNGGAAGSGRVAPPRSPLTLDDLTADLTWPRLLKIARLALRPARIGLGVFLILGLMVLLELANLIDGDANRDVVRATGAAMWRHTLELVHALLQGGLVEASNRLIDLTIRDPAALLRQAPWATLVVLPLMLAWTVIMGGAIARTAATELAWSRTTSWPEALAIALRRWKSLVGAVLLPLALIWIIALGMSAAAWALFDLPVLKVIGALAWGLFLFGGLIVALLSLGFVLGHMLLTPGVVCEGADTIDAVQHAYAMVFAKPVRLLSYVFILALQGVLLGAVVALVIGAAVLTAQLTGRTWTGEGGQSIIRASRQSGLALSDARPAVATEPALTSTTLIEKWTVVFLLIGYGAGVSYWWCASTGLFLAMRRVCDGQEFSELWAPGMVDGTVAESAQVRSATPGTSGELKPPAASEAVIDNGPADEG